MGISKVASESGQLRSGKRGSALPPSARWCLWRKRRCSKPRISLLHDTSHRKNRSRRSQPSRSQQIEYDQKTGSFNFLHLQVFRGGRCWVRTSDLCRVKAARWFANVSLLLDLATFLIAPLLPGWRLRLESLEVRHSPLEVTCHTGLVGDSVIDCLSVQMVPNDMGVGTYL
jgi:hypothetical protein